MAASRVLVNLLTLASTLLLARILMPADFGLVAIGSITLAILSSVTDLSPASALIHHRDPGPRHFDTAWTIGIGRGVVLALVMGLAAWPVAILYHDPRLIGVICALAISPLVTGLANPRMILLTKGLVFWQQFLFEVAKKLVYVAVAVAVALIWRSYWAIIVGTLAADVVGTVISYLVARYRPRFCLFEWRSLVGYSFWLTLAQLANTINWRFDQLLIGGALGKTALGYYTVGDNLASLPTREAIAPLTAPLFPALARVANEDATRLPAVYQSVQTAVTFVALPIGIGVAVTAEPLVVLALSSKWLPSAFIVQMLSAVFALQTLGGVAQPLAMATGHTRMLFVRDMQGLIIRLPTIIAGWWLGGLAGIVYARVLTGSIGCLLNLRVVRDITGLSYGRQIGANGRTLGAAAAMGGSVLLIDRWLPHGTDLADLLWRLSIDAGCGVVVYGAAIALSWRAMGRPIGPETELLGYLGKLGLGRRRVVPAA